MLSKAIAQRVLGLAVLLLVVSLGCSRQTNYVATGTVRNVRCIEGAMADYCAVGFEHDNGRLQTLNFLGNSVAVWKGERFELHYLSDGQGDIDRLEWARRLP